MSEKNSVIGMAQATCVIHPTQGALSSASLQQPSLLARTTKNGNHSRPRMVSNSSSSITSTMLSLDERLDAARSLLGISPCSVTDSSVATDATTTFGGRMHHGKSTKFSLSQLSTSSHTREKNTTAQSATYRPRSNSGGLEALAFLAAQQQERSNNSSNMRDKEGSLSYSSATASTGSPLVQPRLVPLPLPQPHNDLNHQKTTHPSHFSVITSSSSDDDSEAMPPPPPRSMGRRRSISNPEGMEKYAPRSCYRPLVLPASILEEEMAEASAAIKAKEIYEEQGYDDQIETEKETSVDEDRDEQLELDQEELLRRARSRLLEDLSQSNLHGEKGEVTLPHSLEKYKEMYNKNGRIGIYTPAERAAIIARFQSKRSRRVWNKKIRYNCRKNLADRRLRVKGRFVKRSTLEAQKLLQEEHNYQESDVAAEKGSITVTFAPETKDGTCPNGSKRVQASAVEDLPTTAVEVEDSDMPDVNDPDAGFCPTADLPYRRLRRHTIT